MDGLRAQAEAAAEAVLGEVVAAEAERAAGGAVQEARRERDRKVRLICMQRSFAKVATGLCFLLLPLNYLTSTCLIYSS